MTLQNIKKKLQDQFIYYSDDPILNQPTVIGYKKKMEWRLMGSQMNLFIIASDFGPHQLTIEVLKNHLRDSQNYADRNYNGWMKGMFGAIGVLHIMIATNIDQEAIEFCTQLKTEKVFGGVIVPMIIDANTKKAYYFEKKPVFGWIFYPYMKKVIKSLLSNLRTVTC